MILIESYGSIYKLADREYLTILRSIANGLGYRISPRRYLGEVACNLNDIKPLEAEALITSFAKDRDQEKRMRNHPSTLGIDHKATRQDS